ncbi:hypothetical protein CCP4SC76_2580016 [Gammaproteobacteria bacterium]
MTAFVITNPEMNALYGLSGLAWKVYLILRAAMDYATGIVGVVKKISLSSLAEQAETHVPRGRGAQAKRPSPMQVRTALDSLSRAGLIEKRVEVGLIFFLPLARHDVVCPNQTQQSDNTNPTRKTPRTQQATQHPETAPPRGFEAHTQQATQQGGNTTENRMTPQTQHTSGDPISGRESKGDTPLPTPTARTRARASQPPVLPGWIDPQTWHDYETHRKALRKPLVNGSIAHVLRDLEKLRAQGHDPNAVLSQSIVRGWVGVFPLHEDSQPKTQPQSRPEDTRLGPAGRATLQAAERWLNNAQENPDD